MPDFPALSLAQLSVLPMPSEVTTPIPVMAITGRPALSRCALAVGLLAAMMPLSIHPVEQRQTFAAPIAHTGDNDLAQARRARAGIARSSRGEQFAVVDDGAANSQIRHELGVDAMADIGAGIADREPNFLKHRKLGRGRWFKPGGAGNNRTVRGVDLRGNRVPLPPQRRLGFTGIPYVAIRKHWRN